MASSTAQNDSSRYYAPWAILKPYENNTDDLRTLLAPAWVGTPDIRNTWGILQSCILTIFACIYTALHLDVPADNSWGRILLLKLEWVTIALFAPEFALYLAADQLQQALKLKSNLLAFRKRQRTFDIDLRYAFFIVMGGVRMDVSDLISIPDLDVQYKYLFKPSDNHNRHRPRHMVRLTPMAIEFLALRNYWIPITKEEIDDKSKADTIQKSLVLIQVLWMIVQSIGRLAYRLPLSLLEIHTIVHVICAIVLYACWLKKPLDIQQPEIVTPGKLKGEIALLIQRQFYSECRTKLALFTPSSPLQTCALDGSALQLEEVVPQRRPNTRMKMGSILPSGLAYCSPIGDCEVSSGFRRRWRAILRLEEIRSKDRDELARTARRIEIEGYPEQSRLFSVGNRQSFPFSNAPAQDTMPQALYLARLEEFTPFFSFTFSDMPFAEGKRNFDMSHPEVLDLGYNLTMLAVFFLTIAPWLCALAAGLSATYAGVHLAAWNWTFPTQAESVLWKISCIFIASALPAMVALCLFCYFVETAFEDELSDLRVFVAHVMIVALPIYAAARVFVVGEAFLSLRHVPVGVYMTPAWVEMFPHF